MESVLGVGIDSVTISEMAHLLEGSPGFAERVFTVAERAQAALRGDPATYLSGRFAVKEAVYKALAPVLGTPLDLRSIESLDRDNGSPSVSMTGELEKALESCGGSKVLVSITNEGDVATAIAFVE